MFMIQISTCSYFEIFSKTEDVENEMRCRRYIFKANTRPSIQDDYTLTEAWLITVINITLKRWWRLWRSRTVSLLTSIICDSNPRQRRQREQITQYIASWVQKSTYVCQISNICNGKRGTLNIICLKVKKKKLFA